jgi:hypothetical protein
MMLHAIAQRKARVSSFMRDGERKPLEDIVTSTVFGPLMLLTDVDRSLLVKEIIRALDVPIRSVSAPAFLFWHRREETLFRRHSVEPDICIDVGQSSKLIVEVKWGAPLSTDELAAQWASLSPDERRQSAHIFLARDLKGYQEQIVSNREALFQKGIVEWPLRALSWREFSGMLRRISRGNFPGNVRAWASLSASFLSQQGLQTLQPWTAAGIQPASLRMGLWKTSQSIETLAGNYFRRRLFLEISS